MATELDDDEWVTQYIFTKSKPQICPRPQDTDGCSVIRGRLSVREAARYVRFHVHVPYSGDSVRHATVGSLRAAGFTVTPTPSRRNRIHVSVSIEASWTEEVGKDFDECFGDPEPAGGGEQDE